MVCFPSLAHADAHASSRALVLSVLPSPLAPSLEMSKDPPGPDASAEPDGPSAGTPALPSDFFSSLLSDFSFGAGFPACAAHTSTRRKKILRALLPEAIFDS